MELELIVREEFGRAQIQVPFNITIQSYQEVYPNNEPKDAHYIFLNLGSENFPGFDIDKEKVSYIDLYYDAEKKVLRLDDISLIPEHRGNLQFLHLWHAMERIGERLGCNISIPNVVNSKLAEVLPKWGYEQYTNGNDKDNNYTKELLVPVA